MIQLREVSKVYKASGGIVRALDRVTLDVARGEFVAITGPSGCGKTTLLLVVGGLALASDGETVVAGKRLDQISAAERARLRASEIGFVFQTFHLLPYLDVADNVLAAALPGNRAAARRRTDELLDRFGLAARRRHRPGQLSAGERQRAAIARALVNRPAIVLADEPTGNLDPDSGRVVLEMLHEFHRDGGTVLLVTHDEGAAARAPRRIRMERGVLTVPGECHRL